MLGQAAGIRRNLEDLLLKIGGMFMKIIIQIVLIKLKMKQIIILEEN